MLFFLISSLLLVLLVIWWGIFFAMRVAELEEGAFAKLEVQALQWAQQQASSKGRPDWVHLAPPDGLEIVVGKPTGSRAFVHQLPPGDYDTPLIMPTEARQAEIKAYYDRKRTMVIGEGALLLLLVVVSLSSILAAHKRALDLNHEMGNFIQAVTHELKSPLTSLRLLLETLRDNPQAIPEPGPALDAGMVQIKRLERLITNILQASALEGHRLRIQRTGLDLSREVRTFALSREAAVKAAGGTLTVEAPLPVIVRYDRDALHHVLDNLLDNALKYAQGAPQVTLAVHGEEGEGVLEVRDQGVGLAHGQAERVFERFWRAGDELTRTSEGTGLGLYLVKKLVTEGGGRVSASSPGPGLGTIVTIRLPRGTAEDIVPTRDLIPAG